MKAQPHTSAAWLDCSRVAVTVAGQPTGRGGGGVGEVLSIARRNVCNIPV